MPLRQLLDHVEDRVEAPASTRNAVNGDQLATLLTSIRRHLHMHPEVGFQEHETSAFIRTVLERHGMQPTYPLAGTGLYVDIEGASPGRHVGYRADIDALPIQDDKDVPYRSVKPGIAHLCGHDAHTAVAIGLAVLLQGMRDRFAGTVRVFFQPNEEGMPSGAPRMIEDGVLDGLEAVYASHVDPTLEAGRYGLITGPITAAADQFRIEVKGASTGHSARPHQYADTVWIATQIALSLYQMVGRHTDARNPAVLTICRIHGGEAYNVIPARVEFGGTLRTTNPTERERIRQRISEIATATASLYGAEARIEIRGGSPAVINDRRLMTLVEQTIIDEHSEDAVFWVPVPSMGSEDFAHYLQHIPGALLRLGTASGPATAHTLHDSLFDLDETMLAPAARLVSEVLIRHLESDPLSSSDESEPSPW